MPVFNHSESTQSAHARNQRLKPLALACAIALSPMLIPSAHAVSFQAGDTEISLGGYIKFDAAYSQYSDGDLASSSAGRDFYIPFTTPTSTGDGEETSSVDFGARASRFNIKTDTALSNGQRVTTFVELDFLLDKSGNEVVSNSYNPRLRHAFLKTGSWTFGQTWSTFMNVGALPDSVDFVGVSEGTVFNRQAQVRYSTGNWQFALENPETTMVNAGASAGVSTTDDAELPDIVARYNFKGDNHQLSVAAIARQLSWKNGASGDAAIDESSQAFGVNFAGKLNIGADDIRFSLTSGQVARYVGLGSAADASLVDGELEATDVTAAFIAYRHFWNDQWRSTLAYSTLQADYELDNSGDTEEASSVRLNLIYAPVKALSYGVEVSQANHQLDSAEETEGDLTRVQFSAKYSF